MDEAMDSILGQWNLFYGYLHGVTEPIYSIPSFYHFFQNYQNTSLPVEYHIHIWQVPPQLSCGKTCQIWMWFSKSNRNIMFTFDRCHSSLAEVVPVKYECDWEYREYRKISNTRRTKSPNLIVSRLVLQLSLPNPMKPGVKSRMKM